MKSKKPITYSEEQILQWASDFYDRVYGDKQSQDEAEIVDANIDVPKEEVERAEKSLREKFDFVYGEFDKDANSLYNHQENENQAHTEGTINGAVIGAAAVLPTAMGIGIAASISPDIFNYLEAAIVSVGVSAVVAIGSWTLSAIRRSKKSSQANSLGLTAAELGRVEAHEKAMLKFAKEHGSLPTPEDEMNGKVEGSGPYNMYLQMKMLQHEYLMQDQACRGKEQSKEEE